MSFIEELNERGQQIKIHLDVDTGMHRYGIDLAEIDDYLDLIQSCDNVALDGISSHLADGDNHEFTFNEQQANVFDGVVERVRNRGFNPKYLHLANAPGFSKVHSEHANAFRPGIAIYGVNPLTTADPKHEIMDQIKPAMRLVSTVTKIRHLKPGDTVSYGRTFTADKQMDIAVIPIGYYEGLPRSLSNQGALKHGQDFLPIVGRVCMNHTMLDITGKQVEVGDEIVVFSNNKDDSNSIEELSKDYYFFSYGLLTKLNSYVERILVD
jgi:alanine racemase